VFCKLAISELISSWVTEPAFSLSIKSCRNAGKFASELMPDEELEELEEERELNEVELKELMLEPGSGGGGP
jgi:hypothetical protein